MVIYITKYDKGMILVTVTQSHDTEKIIEGSETSNII